MSLEIEGIIESLPTERAQVSLGVVVALQVSVEHPLVLEGLLAHLAHIVGLCCGTRVCNSADCNRGGS